MGRPYMSYTDDNGDVWSRHDDECGPYCDVYSALNGQYHGTREVSNMNDLTTVSRSEYAYGELHGEHMEWDGIFQIFETYCNGVLDGPIAKYSDEADVCIMTGYYVNGKKHGRFTYYNDDGDVQESIMYHNDEVCDELNGDINGIVGLQYRRGSSSLGA
jgi:antitoxin component YwqK of YwqJK toxin-antitoxin module